MANSSSKEKILRKKPRQKPQKNFFAMFQNGMDVCFKLHFDSRIELAINIIRIQLSKIKEKHITLKLFEIEVVFDKLWEN